MFFFATRRLKCVCSVGVARVVKRFYYLDMARLEFTGDKNSYLRYDDNNDNLYIKSRDHQFIQSGSRGARWNSSLIAS